MNHTLKAKLGEKEAQVVVEGIKNSVKEEFESSKEVLATKQDLANIRVELMEKMSRDKNDILKWLFGFWVSLVLLILANWFFK